MPVSGFRSTSDLRWRAGPRFARGLVPYAVGPPSAARCCVRRFAMGERVLILSASAGTGHVRCGEALQQAFSSHPLAEEVAHHDALWLSNRLFRGIYSSLYTAMVRGAPELLGLAYRASDAPHPRYSARLGFDRLNSRRLVQVIREFRPNWIVCTHFMPAGVVSHLLEQGQIPGRLAIVLTDLDCHAMWLNWPAHRYFVAIEETRVHLEALGIPPDRIDVSGIPIDRAFSLPVSREDICARLGFSPGIPILLVSAGAAGVGPAEGLVTHLASLPLPVQVVVICGKRAELRSRIDAAVARFPRFRVLGYTPHMHELMRVCSLFIGKPGGLSTAEALACGLPMVVVSPIPGQEDRNSDHLLEEGVAVRCHELTTLCFKVERLLRDPARLERMAHKARSLGRPHAAQAVADRILPPEGRSASEPWLGPPRSNGVGRSLIRSAEPPHFPPKSGGLRERFLGRAAGSEGRER